MKKYITHASEAVPHFEHVYCFHMQGSWGRTPRGAFSAAKTLFFAILDAILPLRTHSARIAPRILTDIPLHVQTHDLLGVEIITLADYSNTAVTDLIHALKYEASGHAAHLCAQLLESYLLEEMASIRSFSPREIILIPLPLHAARQKDRGFNQIETVLEKIPQEMRTLVRKDVLRRTKHTKQQARLSRHERLRNLKDAFRTDHALRGVHAILIDDVTTTGATLLHAGKALERSGARVTRIALARA